MIAKIVPAVRLPITASAHYDYLIPEGLSAGVFPGTVAAVPFAGRLVAGLVVSVSEEKPTRELKEIYGVCDGVNYPAYWPELLSSLAAEFVSTEPRFAWTALPPVMRNSVMNCCQSPFAPKGGGEKKEFSQETVAVESSEELSDIFKNAVGSGTTLVLVPTVEEAVRWSRLSKDSLVYHSRLSGGEKYAVASACALGAAKTVIGTKSSVFLPFFGLRTILVVCAGSSAHINEDLDPRYDARVVARMLAAAAGARLILADVLPPLALGKFELSPVRPESLRVIDLEDAAARARGKVLLAEETVRAIGETLVSGGRVAVVLNRRGTASSLVCADCGESVLCPDCRVPLIVAAGELECFACKKKYPPPASCPRCRGTNFKNVGSGAKGLYNQVKKIFPEAKAVLVEGGSKKLDLDEFNLVVGTSAVFHGLKPSFKQFSLAVEAMLGAGTGRAGIYAVEESARILRQLKSITTPDGRLIVQTFDPTSPAIHALTAPGKFIADELTERKAFGLPPFGKTVAFHGSGKDEAKLFGAAKKIAADLAAAGLGGVSEPVWGEPKLFRGKFRLSVTAKAAPRQELKNLVKCLAGGWSAEIKEL